MARDTHTLDFQWRAWSRSVMMMAQHLHMAATDRLPTSQLALNGTYSQPGLTIYVRLHVPYLYVIHMEGTPRISVRYEHGRIQLMEYPLDQKGGCLMRIGRDYWRQEPDVKRRWAANELGGNAKVAIGSATRAIREQLPLHADRNWHDELIVSLKQVNSFDLNYGGINRALQWAREWGNPGMMEACHVADALVDRGTSPGAWRDTVVRIWEEQRDGLDHMVLPEMDLARGQ